MDKEELLDKLKRMIKNGATQGQIYGWLTGPANETVSREAGFKNDEEVIDILFEKKGDYKL